MSAACWADYVGDGVFVRQDDAVKLADQHSHRKLRVDRAHLDSAGPTGEKNKKK